MISEKINYKKEERKIKSLIENSEYLIILTDKGMLANASNVEFCSAIAKALTLINNKGEAISKEMIEDAIDLAYMNPDELLEKLKDSLENLSKKINGTSEKKESKRKGNHKKGEE